MARKAHDLLDVFRFGGDDDGEEGRNARNERRKGRKASAKGKKKAAAAPTRSTRFEGIALNRRQVLLASSAIGLLLLLSFFLGLAAGGPGSDDGSATLERRVARRFVIRARVPVLDPAKSKPAAASRIEQSLTGDYGIKPRNLRVRRVGAEFVVEVGPFPSRDEARHWLERSGLELWRIHMQDPFRFPEYVALDGGG